MTKVKMCVNVFILENLPAYTGKEYRLKGGMMRNNSNGYGRKYTNRAGNTAHATSGSTAGKEGDNTQQGRNRVQNNSSQKAAAANENNTASAQQTEQLKNLVNTASKHLNTTPDALKAAAQSGNIQKLLSSLSPAQASQLERILSDEDAAKKLLSTPQAQALLRGMKQNE